MEVLVGNDELFVTSSATLLSRLCFLKRVPALLGKKIFLIDELDAVFFGKVFRAFATHEDVRRFLHHHPRETDRVLDVLDNSSSTGFERLTIHDCGVHFVGAGGSVHRAFAGVEKRIVFEDAHRRFSRVQTRTAML